MALTLGEKRAGRRPIDFYFRSVVDAKTEKVAFIDAFQVLNDIYLGRMNVANYFFIAESSVRINELNLIALSELAEFRKYMYEEKFVPKVRYNLPITTRFLQNEKDFAILQNFLRTEGYKRGDLILTFNCASLVKDGDSAEANKRLIRLRRMGHKVAISGFGAEFNSLDIFAQFSFNQLRVEARYFDASAAKKKLLSMLLRYCRANKIEFIVEGIDTHPQLKRFKQAGVKLVTGLAVCKLNKWVSREMLGLDELTQEEEKTWREKVEAQKRAAQRREAHAEVRGRTDKAQKIAQMALSGKVSRAPQKPAGYKSPYQAQLEQQRKLSRKTAKAQIERQAEDEQEKLAKRKAEQEKAKLEALGGWGLSGLGDTTPIRKSDSDDEVATVESAELEIDRVQDVAADQDTDSSFSATTKDGDELLFEEVSADDDEKEEAQDEEEIEELDEDEKDETLELPQGSYNEQGQWVDAEGNVYNGYFDDLGRWIDYGFYGADGQWLDNGYFDEKEQKWMPFGYFDDEGNWVSLL